MPEYDADFYGWANEQAGLLRAGRLSALDVANIAEEIESMGRSEKRELVNRLAVLLQHMLKWQAQPHLRGSSWALTMQEQRRRLRSHLADNPSLRAKLPEAFGEGFELGLIAAQRETGLQRPAFPAINPWTVELALEEGYYPE